MSLRRLVLLVEGEGDARAAPVLVRRLLTGTEPSPWDVVLLDSTPFRVGGLTALTGRRERDFHRHLENARRRGGLGGVLVLLDGDVLFGGPSPCPVSATARALAESARAAGAGTVFSLAVVLALQEYESWLIAGYPSLPGAQAEADLPPRIEEAPRDAAGWLNRHLEGGYLKKAHQAGLTDTVDLALVRGRGLRSFRRLENALAGMVTAFRSGQHILTPAAADPGD